MGTEGVNEIRRATPSIKQTIRDALNEQQVDVANKRDKRFTRNRA